jgi:predicted acylesterase/phospholipase RssA
VQRVLKGVLRGAVWSLAVIGIAAVAVLGARWLRIVPLYEPIGECIKGDIDLNDPKPFVQLEPGVTVVGLAASGGGSRAAYLAAAILREMRASSARIETGATTEARSLIDQIDAVSAVSGGALTAAYFVAYGEQLRSADVDSPTWRSFLDKMALSYRLRQWYGLALIDPRVWAKYLFSNYHRGLLARDDYDATLFRGATLADLPSRPALYLNSFDVANHVRFVFSKHYIDTAFFQPRGYWGMLSAPQDLTSENDLTFIKVEPKSVRLADAVTASSAFPFAYPNVALNHCGTKILFQGRRIFLADGALADNSGLVTLLTQLRAALEGSDTPHKVVVIAIDATLDRLNTEGSRFRRRGNEDRYAYESTVVGHGVESVESAVALMQDLGTKFLEGSGVETDQIKMNWHDSLTKRAGACGPASKTSWANLFEDGRLAVRPLIIRLGLRDIMDPDFEGQYVANLVGKEARFDELLRANNAVGDSTWPALQQRLETSLAGIDTDFVLTEKNRHALDLAAYLLVQAKLAGDIAAWNAAVHDAKPVTGVTCH